ARHAEDPALGQVHPLAIAPEGEAAFEDAEEFLFLFMDMKRRSFARGNLGLEAAEAPSGLVRGNADEVAPEGEGFGPAAGKGKGSLVKAGHSKSPDQKRACKIVCVHAV